MELNLNNMYIMDNIWVMKRIEMLTINHIVARRIKRYLFLINKIEEN